MSEDPKEPKEPTLKAGDEIISMCPVCLVGFQEKVATNINHVCPNPKCKKTFCVMVFD